MCGCDIFFAVIIAVLFVIVIFKNLNKKKDPFN